MSIEAIGALERGTRRSPYRETVDNLADALKLDSAQRAEFAASVDRTRGSRIQSSVARPRSASTLPVPATSFIGRAADLNAIAALLAENRLVTITGSGGIGKTRTAIETASRLGTQLGREVIFIDLSSIADPATVVPLFAAAFGLRIPEKQGIDSIVATLEKRDMLLVIDNCEHVLTTVVPLVVAVLRSCPAATVLATSRERLAVSGEAIYRLPSLDIPSEPPATLAEARAYAAIDLFISRAQAMDITFSLPSEGIPTLVSICRRLDGIPLALEIAARRLFAFGLFGLHDQLKNSLVLTARARDLPARQQTMLATIAWSYDLLGSSERVILHRLSVFSGGFCLAAAATICADLGSESETVTECIASLIDKSLVTVAGSGVNVRYTLLDSVRSFARAKLVESGESTFAHRLHAEWMARFAESLDSLRNTRPDYEVMQLAEPEFANMRAAIEWALGSSDRDDVVFAARIASGFFPLWILYSGYDEGLLWAEAALERLDAERHPRVAARLLPALIQMAKGMAVVPWANRAIPVFKQVDDIGGLALLHATVAMTYQHFKMRPEADAEIDLASTIADTIQLPPKRHAVFLHHRSFVRLEQGRFDDALADITLGTTLAREGGDVDVMMWTLYRADIEFARGNVEAAIPLIESVLARALSKEGPHDREIIAAASRLTRLRVYQNDLDGAHEAAREALIRCQGNIRGANVDGLLEFVALLEALRGNMTFAAKGAGFVDAWRREHGVFRNSGPRGEDETERLFRLCRERLAERVFQALLAEGANMMIDRVFAEALRVVEQQP